MSEQIAWIELCGLTFSGAQTADYGLVWENLTGWDGLTDARSSGDPIPGEHGVYRRGQILRTSRSMTLTGYILADSYPDLVATRDRLTAALAAGAGVMQVATESGTWERYVEIESAVPEPDHGDRIVDVTIDMVAPDPRRYAPAVTVGPVSAPIVTGGVTLPQAFPWNFGSTMEGGGRLLVTNSGSIPCGPRIRISGGFSAVTVREITTARRVRLERAVEEGQELVFDMGARRAYIDGAEMTRYMTARQWAVIPPGETFEFRFEADSPTGQPLMWADYQIGAW